MQYHILKALSYILCLLPHKLLLIIGKWLGVLYYYVAPKQRKRAIRHIMQGMAVSEEDARLLCMDNFINIGKTFLEIMYMPRLKPENLAKYIEIDHIDWFKAALAEGHGVVILTAHIGNWEWLSAALTFSGIPLTAIIKRQPNDQHTVLLNEFREMVGVEVFSRGTTELVAAAKSLKKGKALGFLADQDAGPSGAFIEFLNKPASTPLGPAVFAKRFNSPIVPSFIVRKKDGTHKVIIHKPLYYENTGDEDAALYDITVQMTKLIESTIREYPDQWLWFQKRWNTPVSMKKEKAKKDKVKNG
jgi:KDO2-lipid IV(A) lauroyltransferase